MQGIANLNLVELYVMSSLLDRFGVMRWVKGSSEVKLVFSDDISRRKLKEAASMTVGYKNVVNNNNLLDLVIGNIINKGLLRVHGLRKMLWIWESYDINGVDVEFTMWGGIRKVVRNHLDKRDMIRIMNKLVKSKLEKGLYKTIFNIYNYVMPYTSKEEWYLLIYQLTSRDKPLGLNMLLLNPKVICNRLVYKSYDNIIGFCYLDINSLIGNH